MIVSRRSSCASHFSIPYSSACVRSGGVSISVSALLSSVSAISRAVDMVSFVHRRMCSSVSYCRVWQFGHRPLILLSRSCILLRVGVHLCCSLVVRVCLYCGIRLIVCPIAVQEISLKICSVHPVCFSSIRFRSGPSDVWNRMNLV